MRYPIKYILLLSFFIVPTALSFSQELNFGYASGENIVSIINKFTPMMNYLSKKTGLKVNFVRTVSYAETQEGFINGVLDMGILNTLSFLEIEGKHAVIPIAERLKRGKNTYQTYILVREDSPVKSIRQLNGKIFAFGDPNSTSSTLMPQKLLQDAGIEIHSNLKQFIYFQKQDSILYAILNRTVDAGAVASFIFNESDNEVKDLLKVISKSDPFPLGPFVVSTRMDRNLRDKLTRILLDMNRDEEGKQALADADLEGFTFFRDEDFDPLRQMYRKKK